MDPKMKKVFAVVGIVILIGVIIALLIVTQTSGKGKEDEGEEGPPPYKMPPNVAVTTLNRDNNEPTIAINPNDQLTMVAGSNDYNTPQSDAWPGYYTTHDGGRTWTEKLIPGYPGDSDISELTGFHGGGDNHLR